MIAVNSGEPKRFAIAGGGIAGFATAIALARLGLPSTIFERRAEFSDEGAGIQIGPNGTRVLEELGVASSLRDKVGTPAAVSVRDGRSGSELARLPLGKWLEARHGAPYWTAHRADLQSALRTRAATLPLITVRTAAAVTNFVEEAGGVRVFAEGCESDFFAGLIGADGLWSSCRVSIAKGSTPVPTGKTAYRAVVTAADYPANLSQTDVHIWLLPGAHAVHYPVRAGREFAVIIILDDAETLPGWSTPASLEAVANASANFPTPLRSIVAGSTSWRRWSLNESAPLATWIRGRTVLIGDAAHPMQPFLAQGAVMALEDALCIAGSCATEGEDIAAAFSRFETMRKARAQRVTEASRMNGRIYHLSGAAAAARNAVLRSVPSSLLMSRLDWLYGATA